MTDDEKSLQEFLTNISCLDPIEKAVGRVSMFDVLGMARNEIRHSRVLRWLLDPNETHGMGPLFLRVFLQRVCEAGGNAFDLLTADLNTFSVFPEYKHIDLLLVSKESKVVVAIENKVDSSEHDNQLKRYEGVLKADFPTAEFKRAFVFLTPEGDEPSDTKWLSVSYRQIIEAIDYCRHQKTLAPDVALMLEHYQNLLMREFMMENEIAKICNKIYKEHKRALDMIFEFKEDRASIVKDIIEKWFECDEAKGSGLVLDKDHSCKTCIRFSTEKLESVIPLLPDGRRSGWGSSHSAYYEIVNRASVKLKLCCSSSGMSSETTAKIKSVFELKNLSSDWKWKTLHNFGASVQLRQTKDSDEIWDEEQVASFMRNVVKAVHEYEKHF